MRQRIVVWLSVALLAYQWPTGDSGAGWETPRVNVRLPLEKATSNSAYHDKAWYTLSLGNVTIGRLMISGDPANKFRSSDYTLHLTSRIGNTPLLTFVQGKTQPAEGQHVLVEQTYQSILAEDILTTTQHIWNFPQSVESPNTIFPFQTSAPTSNALPSSFSPFYYRPSAAPSALLVPFVGRLWPTRDLQTQYDPDGFLHSGLLPLNDFTMLQVRRVTKGEWEEALANKQDLASLLDLTTFNLTRGPQGDAKVLAQSLEQCLKATSSLSAAVVHSIPHSNYLFYRKITNLNALCQSLQNGLQNSSSTSFIRGAIGQLLQEHNQETPRALIFSPDLPYYYNDSLSFIWPYLTAHLITQGVEEVLDTFQIETSRKSLLGLVPSLKSLKQRAVVRAHISLVQPLLTTSVETTESMSQQSDKGLGPADNPWINGQYFAQHPVDLNAHCIQTGGNIGLDLGEAAPVLLTGNIKGFWDLPTRLEVSRLFLFKAVAAPQCQTIKFKAPLPLKNPLKKQINEFAQNILGSSVDILLSNEIQKKLWTMPGTYHIQIYSLITGKMIAQQEFFVGENSNTNVTLKVN